MKHRVVGRRLDRTTEHRTAMFRNMVTSLLRHERITTTVPKAKELKRVADKIVTLAKRGTSNARRIAYRDVRDAEVLEKLFGPLKDRYATRAGGYTRIIRVGRRRGDNAEVAIIELVDRAPAPEEKGGADEGATTDKKTDKKKSEKKAPASEKTAAKGKAKKAAKGE
jgi:large subunit ribosomal protein L17